MKNLAILIAPGAEELRVGDGVPVHFEAAFGEIDEPEVADAGSGVEWTLVVAVIVGGRFGDLDDERGAGRASGRAGGCVQGPIARSGSGSEVKEGRARGI